MDPQAFNASLV